MAPLLQAALFYVQTAAGDLLAAQREISTLQAACAQVTLRPGEARARLEAFIAGRARAGRGIPAAPHAGKIPGAVTADGIVQAPDRTLISLLAGIPGGLWYHHARLVAAGNELGYEQGGLNTAMSPWPGSGRPWRPRLDTASLRAEMFHLRTACWIVIAYLSGMRDTEVRELARDCAFTEPGRDGRTRCKLRGRVFKDRASTGDAEEWVVLDVVHHAVGVLLAVNDDATHLFGYSGVRKDGMNANMLTRLNRFAAHVNDLLTPPGGEAFIPGHGDSQAPWELTTTPVPPDPGLAHRSPAVRDRGRRPPVQARPGHDLRGLRRHLSFRVRRRSRSRTGRRRPGLRRRPLPRLAGRRTLRRRRRPQDQRRVRPHPRRARRPARHHRRPQAPAHHAQPPGRHLAPRRARRLLLPARHRALRQAARPTRRQEAPADAEHLPDLPERAPFQRSPATPGTSPRPGPADHRRVPRAAAAAAASGPDQSPRPARPAHQPDHQQRPETAQP